MRRLTLFLTFLEWYQATKMNIPNFVVLFESRVCLWLRLVVGSSRFDGLTLLVTITYKYLSKFSLNLKECPDFDDPYC